MAWQGILGHDEIVEQFRCCLSRGRLASTFLFVGPAGVGKRTFAMKLAQALLCQTKDEADLDPCGHCPSCVQVLAATHPDLQQIACPPEKSTIPVEMFIGPPERRMQEGLCHQISLKPFMGGRRIALIDDADELNVEGANCLLKTLEEPPPRSVLILIGTSAEQQLPTIRSRCQIVRFRPLADEIVARLLVDQQIVADSQQAQRLASYSEGSLQRARELADPQLWVFRRDLLEQLSQPRLDSVRLAKQVTAFVEEAGKEAYARRARAPQLVAFAAEYYRHVLRAVGGTPLPADADLEPQVDRVRRTSRRGCETWADCFTRCLDALEQIDRNAHQANLLECWLDDLAQAPFPAG